MAATEQDLFSGVAKAVVADVGRGAQEAAQKIIPKNGMGQKTTTKAAMLAHVRDAWPDPQLRQALFSRMVPAVQGPDGQVYPARNGLTYFENLVKEAFPLGYPEPMPMFPPVNGTAGGFEPVPY